MVLLYTLNANFKETTAGFNPLGVWAVRITLLIIAIAILMMVTAVITGNVPETFSYS